MKMKAVSDLLLNWVRYQVEVLLGIEASSIAVLLADAHVAIASHQQSGISIDAMLGPPCP